MKEARSVYEHIPALKETLMANPDDYAVLELAKHAPKGVPTTSFAGQGAAFAGMAVQSYQDFVAKGGTPEAFNGVVVYQEHLLGKSGAHKFREALAENPDKKGKPGVGKPTYKGNYLMVDHPFAGLNDLNSDRLVYSAATPNDVDRMLHDKFIFAYITREKKGANLEKLKGFEDAFLPEWRDPARKEADIRRVKAAKELGGEMRGSPEIRADVCTVLMPMQAFNTMTAKATSGPAK